MLNNYFFGEIRENQESQIKMSENNEIDLNELKTDKNEEFSSYDN